MDACVHTVYALIRRESVNGHFGNGVTVRSSCAICSVHATGDEALRVFRNSPRTDLSELLLTGRLPNPEVDWLLVRVRVRGSTVLEYEQMVEPSPLGLAFELGASVLDELFRRCTSFVRAVLVTQAHFLKQYYCPRYSLCRRRLEREFAELRDEARPSSLGAAS